MKVDPEHLRRHYALLSDESLLALDSDELIPVARSCYYEELARRGLTVPDAEVSDEPNRSDGEVVNRALDTSAETDPNWMEDAVSATVFLIIDEAVDACQSLRAAGIPCEISEHDREDADRAHVLLNASEAVEASQVLRAAGISCELSESDLLRKEYRVMVPGALSLQATSVLDVEIFNQRLEDDWITHLGILSDADFRLLNAESICAGLLDRVKRLTRAYNQEVARRGLQ